MASPDTPCAERCRSLLEQLLTPACGSAARELAHRLIERFGTLSATLAAPSTELASATNDRQAVAVISATHDAMLWSLRTRLDERPLLSNDLAVMEYARVAQGFAHREIVRVLYLDAGNRLLAEEELARGTVDEAPIYIREIIRRALELGATGLIIAHNHPSGDVTPSRSDRTITDMLAKAGKPLGIRVLDHVLVSRDQAVSFHALGWL
ncbi:DNA repair protein RadC [Sphingomonas sp. AOB5]|uniref:JAB domain-containing protein n=1 Tax=Sphingomonas sp. AOB5 TaxID=3034017 RepID=UPI0023F77BA5|nr:DNA repair protein RadC [Sphingomonas sp. AOB5]MDF7774278.1 DNA repair protein RadC [Sphingomonas sp. AOB5]